MSPVSTRRSLARDARFTEVSYRCPIREPSGRSRRRASHKKAVRRRSPVMVGRLPIVGTVLVVMTVLFGGAGASAGVLAYYSQGPPKPGDMSSQPLPQTIRILPTRTATCWPRLPSRGGAPYVHHARQDSKGLAYATVSD